MKKHYTTIAWMSAFILMGFSYLGCSSDEFKGASGDGGALSDGSSLSSDSFSLDFLGKSADKPHYTADTFFAKDPPPQYCGPDGGWTPPPVPGGTPECPDDKNLEGCPCSKKDEKAACWPGLRTNRNRGICKDGVTTCQLQGELTLRWGPCEGDVLPVSGVTEGPDACMCFSRGQWEIKNLIPCFITYNGTKTYAVSTFVDTNGEAKCPSNQSNVEPPKPQPGQVWSKNILDVDCTGQFKLCYTIKAGSFENPQQSDCTIAQSCTEAFYAKQDTPQELPNLPSWVSSEFTCIKKFIESGGYGEMSVIGTSTWCEEINDNGNPLVFHRVAYCPAKCMQQPDLPECQKCGNGASGDF